MGSSIILVLTFIVCVQLSLAEDETTAPTDDFQRTVIFIQRQTAYGQDLFLRGGSDNGEETGAVPIEHRLDGGENEKFKAWKVGDNYLDWYGAENGQGSFGGTAASGTPMVWTTNNETYSATVSEDGFGYSELNEWGDHYWMVDVNMDCSQTENGWFEVKRFLPGEGWEGDVWQNEICDGDAGDEERPYTSHNHFGRCGFINVFTSESNDCYINSFE